MVFCSSPGGFKKGGVDHRLDYYGKSMVGIMSREAYLFYTGPYDQSINQNTGESRLSISLPNPNHPTPSRMRRISNTSMWNKV